MSDSIFNFTVTKDRLSRSPIASLRLSNAWYDIVLFYETLDGGSYETDLEKNALRPERLTLACHEKNPAAWPIILDGLTAKVHAQTGTLDASSMEEASEAMKKMAASLSSLNRLIRHYFGKGEKL